MVGRDMVAKRDLHSAGLLVYDRIRQATMKSRPCVRSSKRSVDDRVVVVLPYLHGVAQ